MGRLEDSVFHLMRRALQEHNAHWQASVPALTKPQFAVLNVIAEEPGIDQATAGQRAAIDKATLAGLMLRLEERGLLTRTIGADRRRRTLSLTAEGERVLRATTPEADELNEATLARLSDADRRRLRDLLAKITG